MDAISRADYVDGVEFYSTSPYEQTECDLRAIAVAAPEFRTRNPSTHLLFETLRLFLARSSAGWLFLINDAAHVRTDRLDRFFREEMAGDGGRAIFARGSCVERRFYFQMLSITSGILITRSTAERLLAKDEMWNVTMEIGLPAEEALNQILDDIGVRARASKRDDFLGQPFRVPNFRQNLLNKEFSDLQQCQKPSENPEQPGVAAVCSTEITKMNELIVWAGAGRNNTDKEWFLTHAKIMLENLPDKVHFVWDRLYPALCKQS
jgi:hypothetical protein